MIKANEVMLINNQGEKQGIVSIVDARGSKSGFFRSSSSIST